MKLPFAFSAFDHPRMENTPVVFNGRPLLVQNHRPAEADKQESGSYLFIEDLTTGQEVARLGTGFSFVSAYVDGDQMNLFAAVNTNREWTKDIHRFWSTDLKTWHQEPAIARAEGEHLFNSSVCRDDQGYVMAYESNKPVQWSFRFARSKDLSHWAKVDGVEFADVEGKTACGNPTIRYFAPYYYVIYGMWRYQGPGTRYEYLLPETKYVTAVARSKDLVVWDLSPTRGPMLDPSPGEGINNTDADLFEHEGKTYLYYATGEQTTEWGTIRVAMYAGPMKEMLEAYFPAGTPTIRFDARQRKYIDPPKSGRPSADDGGETAQERDRRMAWWREARFGMFVHFGLFSLPTEEPRRMDKYFQLPIEEFHSLAGRFDPKQCDPEQWASLASRAGMKYLVLVAKSHDGWCLFDSRHTEFDVMATPYRRDLLKPLAEACRREGIKLCLYYSIIDWDHLDYLPRRDVDHRPVAGADLDRYVAYMKDQLRELLTEYGPIGVIWFDGNFDPSWTDERGTDLYRYVRRLQPDVIVNNRVGRNCPNHISGDDPAGDFDTPEQMIPEIKLRRPDWETCMTMNDHWQFIDYDQNWKSAAVLIRHLVDVASKGGNFLLDVGPRPDGDIPATGNRASRGDRALDGGQRREYPWNASQPAGAPRCVGPVYGEDAARRRDAVVSDRVRLAQGRHARRARAAATGVAGVSVGRPWADGIERARRGRESHRRGAARGPRSGRVGRGPGGWAVKLRDKVAVITGGSAGIGFGCARVFGKYGCTVVIGSRGQEAGRAAEKELVDAGHTAVFVPTDVTVAADVARLIETAVERFGRLDCLRQQRRLAPAGRDDRPGERRGLRGAAATEL